VGATKGLRRKWKSEELLNKKPTVYDWCRLAAFLDGEGSLGLSKNSKRTLTRLSVTGTSEDLILWLVETFGGAFHERGEWKKNSNWSVAYNWSCSAARAAWILWNCKPWFIIKGKQAELLLEYQNSVDNTVQNRYKLLPNEIKEWRDMISKEITKLNARGPKEAQETA
jgi:hypothetical protein